MTITSPQSGSDAPLGFYRALALALIVEALAGLGVAILLFALA